MSANRVVSSESELLILVDESDRETGYLTKAECHDGEGVLHRAFSVFLFNDAGELLLQQRAASKRLWPMYWSNSCCSHPRRGESMEVATRRRLSDELNVVSPLEFVYKFRYQAEFGNAGSEHELCHVFVGRLSGPPQPNISEIAAMRFLPAPEIDGTIDAANEAITPWFRLEWRALRDEHAAMLDRYIG